MARSGTNHKGGRPKGSKGTHTLQAEQARKYVIERITAELEPIMDTHISLAKKGDGASLKYLTDQLIGKAKETLEVESTTKLLIDE